jgi:hypothetical protein
LQEVWSALYRRRRRLGTSSTAHDDLLELAWAVFRDHRSARSLTSKDKIAVAPPRLDKPAVTSESPPIPKELLLEVINRFPDLQESNREVLESLAQSGVTETLCRQLGLSEEEAERRLQANMDRLTRELGRKGYTHAEHSLPTAIRDAINDLKTL